MKNRQKWTFCSKYLRKEGDAGGKHIPIPRYTRIRGPGVFVRVKIRKSKGKGEKKGKQNIKGLRSGKGMVRGEGGVTGKELRYFSDGMMRNKGPRVKKGGCKFRGEGVVIRRHVN